MDFTAERKAKAEAAFEAAAKEGRLEAREVHKILFNEDEPKEYSFSSFEEDLRATVTSNDELTWEQCEEFLAENL